MYARALIYNYVDPVEIQIKLFGESRKELFAQVHVEKGLCLIVLRVQILIKLVLGIELDCILAPHKLVRDGATDR